MSNQPKETWKLWKQLEQDRSKVKNQAGLRRKLEKTSRSYHSIRAGLVRFERLARMVELAIESEAFRDRQPTFDPQVFLREFPTAVEDWDYVGVLIDPTRLYQPGTFVAHRNDILASRNIFRGLHTRGLRETTYNWFFARYAKDYDKYGRRK